MTLVPAFLTLMGEKSWYIPRWLDRLLPNITIEPRTTVTPTTRRPSRPRSRPGAGRTDLEHHMGAATLGSPLPHPDPAVRPRLGR